MKLKVGKKGYILLPKAIREAVGIEEGGEVYVEVKDGVILRPVRKVDARGLREALEAHRRAIEALPTREPKPGELAKVSLEKEFEG